MRYILLIDENEDILNIQTMILSSFYGGDVVAVANGYEALERVEAFGAPELIVADHKLLTDPGNSLYNHLSKHDLLIPLVICSTLNIYEGKERNYPLVTTFVQKPYSIDALGELVKSLTTEPILNPHFIPVKLSILLNLIGNSFDLYLKLSESNFVKVLKQGDSFTAVDSGKLEGKGVTHLYVSMQDSLEFLKAYEANLNLLLGSRFGSNEENIVNVIYTMSSIEKVSKRLGWTPEVIGMAQRSLDSAFLIISKNASLMTVLKKKLSKTNDHYAQHVGLLAYMCCIFSQNLGWGGELVATKLALAALLHDLAVEESYYGDIKSWNKKAANLSDKSPETIKYRLHPIEASKLIQSMKILPPDIDQILLQHHEKKDGSGFPRALSSLRISQLATFFNIVEELVEFIGNGENLETSLIDFKTWGDAYYDTGHFKKAYDLIKINLI